MCTEVKCSHRDAMPGDASYAAEPVGRLLVSETSSDWGGTNGAIPHPAAGGESGLGRRRFRPRVVHCFARHDAYSGWHSSLCRPHGTHEGRYLQLGIRRIVAAERREMPAPPILPKKLQGACVGRVERFGGARASPLGSAAADEGHFCCHHCHEQDVCVEWQARHVDDGVSDVFHVEHGLGCGRQVGLQSSVCHRGR
jgi:hypothetical protein